MNGGEGGDGGREGGREGGSELHIRSFSSLIFTSLAQFADIVASLQSDAIEDGHGVPVESCLHCQVAHAVLQAHTDEELTYAYGRSRLVEIEAKVAGSTPSKACVCFHPSPVSAFSVALEGCVGAASFPVIVRRRLDKLHCSSCRSYDCEHVWAVFAYGDSCPAGSEAAVAATDITNGCSGAAATGGRSEEVDDESLVCQSFRWLPFDGTSPPARRPHFQSAISHAKGYATELIPDAQVS